MEQGKERRTLTIHIYTPSDAAHKPGAQPTHHPPIPHQARPAPRTQEPCWWEAAESPLAGAKSQGLEEVQKYRGTEGRQFVLASQVIFSLEGGRDSLGWMEPREVLSDLQEYSESRG